MLGTSDRFESLSRKMGVAPCEAPPCRRENQTVRNPISGPGSRVFGLLAICALGACSSLFGPDEEVVWGRLSYHDFAADPQVPDTVTVGTPFQVVVQTYGGGCIGFGHTTVEYTSQTVDVRVYDIDNGSDVCTDELTIFDHTAEITVDSPGTWLIRVHGRDVPPDTAVVVERSIYAR